MENNFTKTINGFIDSIKRKTLYGLYNTNDFGFTDYEKKEALSLYYLSAYLNKAINKRAEKVGSTKFLVKDLKGNVLEDAGQVEWIYKLFNRPNKIMSGKQFFTSLQKHKDVYGKAYVLCRYEGEAPELFGNDTLKKVKKIESMHLLNPVLVKENFNIKTNEIETYTYTSKEATAIYKATEVVRIVRPKPNDPLEYESIIEAGKKIISTGIQLDDYQSNILKNGGSVKGMVKFKEANLTADQVEKQKDRYKQQVSEAKRAGIPLFLGGDAEYSETGLRPEELGYIASKNAVLNDICILTGVPKSILGNFDEIKYDNAKASHRIFLQETIAPEVDDIVESFNWTIIPDQYNLSYEEFIPEDIKEKIEILQAGSNSYCLTTNDKRKIINSIVGNIDEVKEGDTILAPFNLSPLGTSTGETEKKIKTKGLIAFLKEESKLKYAEVVNKFIDKRAKTLEEGVLNFAREQEKRVFKALTFEKKKGIKTDLNEIKGEEIKLAVDFILPYLEKFIEDSGNDALDMLGLSKPLEITDRIKKIAKARADFYAESTTDTTFDKLFKTLTEGFEGNETIQTLTERVQNVFKEFPEHRAEMIARTEATVSNNDGLLESYKQSGVVEGKEWIAVMDSKTRPEHQMLNGEVVELNKNFSNGLPYPSEPNCRCVIGPAIDE